MGKRPGQGPTAVLALTLSALLAPVPAAAGQGRDQRHPDFEHLSARWSMAMREMNVPGMAVVVMELDQVLHLETFGLRDVVAEEPVTPGTMFYIASATKPFVAFAARRLAEQGRLELDAPAKRYLPRLELADAEAARTLTVRDLLCHRPGINSFPVVFLDAYSGEITEDRYYHFLRDAQPTGQVTYTNVHFTLAGRVLESVTGEPWRSVLERLIFEPAGMSRTTGYADAMYADEDVALPTVWRDGVLVPSTIRKTDRTMHAAGGLGTTVTDLARWIGLHLNRGFGGERRLLSEEGIDELLTLQASTPDAQRRGLDGFGLGWMLGETYGHRRAQHGGGYVGSAALISFLPELGLGVAVLANTDGAGSALCELVTDDVYDHLLAEQRYDPLPGILARVKRAQSSASSSSPEGANPAATSDALSLPAGSYAGEYTNAHWGTLRLTLDEGGLAGRLGSIRLSLHERGPDRFLAYAQGSVQSDASFRISGGEPVAVVMDISGHEVVFER